MALRLSEGLGLAEDELAAPFLLTWTRRALPAPRLQRFDDLEAAAAGAKAVHCLKRELDSASATYCVGESWFMRHSSVSLRAIGR